MKNENDPICVCRFYHAESDKCGFAKLSDEFETELDPCRHVQCMNGCYESIDAFGMSLDEYQEYMDNQPSWAELFGFKRFICPTFGIVREFV